MLSKILAFDPLKLFLSIILFCIISFLQLSYADSKIDSLLHVIKTTKEDTAKVSALIKLCDEYRRAGEEEKAKEFCNQALDLSIKIGFLKGQGSAYANTGIVYYSEGNYEKALENQMKSLEITEVIGDKLGSAMSYNSIGNVYNKQGNYNRALENYLKALKLLEAIGDMPSMASSYNNIGTIYYNLGSYEKAVANHLASLKIKEEIGDKKGIAASYNNIGGIYYQQRNYNMALENYSAALKIQEEMRDKKGIAGSYNNIGNIYSDQNNYDKALFSFLKALGLQEEIGNRQGIAESYNNIGNIYNKKSENTTGKDPQKIKSQYEKALENYFISLKIKEEIGDKKGIASSCTNIADIYTKQKKFPEAETMLNRSLGIAKETGDKDRIKSNYLALSELYEALGNGNKGLVFHKLYSDTKDSILNEQSSMQIAKMQTIYETDKKQKEIELLNKDNEIKTAENKKQRIAIYSSIGGLLLVLTLVFFIYRSNRQKYKANLMLERKNISISQKNEEIEKINKELEKQNVEIAQKNKDITDSINYAKRIQGAMLPHRNDIWDNFHQSFVLLKPKDIVSGDFYFFSRNHEGSIIAVADCTGHGVPGAFMSILGTEKLHDAVEQTRNPCEILQLLNQGVKQSLHHSEDKGTTHDGMDIALCVFNKEMNLLEYAGANRNLWIITKEKNDEIFEIKATKAAIGGYTPDNKEFDLHKINLNSGDTIYISSDGFADQFSPNHKKLMTKKFKEILISVQDKSMKEQKEFLNSFVDDWRGTTEQTDDILVIGIRI